MPLPWSKSAPKSNRRVEWKDLKAKHAKTINPSKVEVGLGKALDAHQKQVDAVLLLEANELKAEAFGPVLLTAATVKRLAVGLEPKVKSNTDYVEFLTALKKDADWWTKTGQEIKTAPAHISDWNAGELTTALNNLMKLNTCIIQLDTMLKDAGKKTQTYTPPPEVTKWLRLAQKLKPVLTKTSVLAKNRTGNFKLIMELLQGHKENISLARTYGMHLVSVQRDNPNLQPVANWDEVMSAANDAEEAASAADKAIGRFRDR